MFNNDTDFIFMSQPFWREMGIPQDFVVQKYKEYFGQHKISITSRKDAITFISPVLNRIQSELLDWLNSTGTNQVIKSLYLIFDKCFKFYINQKAARKKLVALNIQDEDINEVFSTNRNFAINVINSANLWIENALLFQNSVDDPLEDKTPTIDPLLFVKLYIYGISSRALSLLNLSNKFNQNELFYGINYSIQYDEEPIDIIREHPVIYFNPSLTGNQGIFKLSKKDYLNADSSVFGTGFYEEHKISFLLSMKLLSTFQKYLLLDGKHAYVVITKSKFLSLIDEYTQSKIDPHAFFDTFVLSNSNVSSQLRKNESLLWIIGTNKYRHELRPFLCLSNDTVAISYYALEQAKQLWCSYFANGGMTYSNTSDKLTTAIERRNEELSNQLVAIIRDQLKELYTPSFDECDVKYDRIFGVKEYDYGDYDVVFYTKQTNELFLIEAKFFSDSLNNSGTITDYEKLFKANGYYDHCRKRYDLVLREPEKIKNFIGASGPLNVHFLFLSSKPLEIEFTDKDRVVSFPCLSIFKNYLAGNLISEDGHQTIRPTHQI